MRRDFVMHTLRFIDCERPNRIVHIGLNVNFWPAPRSIFSGCHVSFPCCIWERVVIIMADEGKGLQSDPLSTSCSGTRSSELSDETVEKYEKLKCLHFMGEYRMCLC